MTSRSANRLSLLSFQLIFFLQDSVYIANAACSICPSGDPITLPDRQLNLKEPFSIDTCGKLNSFMPFISASSDDCTGIRTLGGLCGCPVMEGTCRLCPSSNLQDPTATLTNEITEVVQSAPAGLALTCEFVDSYLQSYFQADEDLCDTTRQVYLPECACGEDESDTSSEGDAAATKPPTVAPTSAPSSDIPTVYEAWTQGNVTNTTYAGNQTDAQGNSSSNENQANDEFFEVTTIFESSLLTEESRAMGTVGLLPCLLTMVVALGLSMGHF